LDYHTLFFDTPENLGDEYHSNYKGSEILSKKVYEDIKALDLPNKAPQENLSTPKENKKERTNLSIYFLLATSLELLILFILLASVKKKSF